MRIASIKHITAMVVCIVQIAGPRSTQKRARKLIGPSYGCASNLEPSDVCALAESSAVKFCACPRVWHPKLRQETGWWGRVSEVRNIGKVGQEMSGRGTLTSLRVSVRDPR